MEISEVYRISEILRSKLPILMNFTVLGKEFRTLTTAILCVLHEIYMHIF